MYLKSKNKGSEYHYTVQFIGRWAVPAVALAQGQRGHPVNQDTDPQKLKLQGRSEASLWQQIKVILTQKDLCPERLSVKVETFH